MHDFGKILVLIGLLLFVLGSILIVGNKLPFVGKLPGDIVIERRDYSFYFPVTTCIIISIVLSFVFWIFSKK